MMTPEMTSAQQDESAVAAVRGGDAERYRELVERHERRVYAVAWSRLGDAALAEEATQEAFIRAYRRLWLLGDGAKFSGWVNTIARRVAINFGLRHRRELNKRQRWALENPAISAPENSAETDPLHTPETLRQTLAELPAAHRECLVLFYLEGKSGAEAAASLGISEAALRVRLHRARAAMRERLEEKLAGSLANLRPAKTLVPAIMAGVLASSSAKAAAGGVGATLTGALAKIGLAKWLLPLGSLMAFAFILPGLLASWLFAQLELKNFRDQKGFRAELFRSHLRSRVSFVIVAIIAGTVVVLAIEKLIAKNLFPDFSAHFSPFWIVAALTFLWIPFSLRQLTIVRNPYFIVQVGGQMLTAGACVATALNLLPSHWVMVFIFGQTLLSLPFYGHRPVRMDYNLFLRALEKLLRNPAEKLSATPCDRREILAFARFLGTRWLANHFGWTAGGLRLRLPSPDFGQWTSWLDLMINFSWHGRSQMILNRDGGVRAELGKKDLRALQTLHGSAPVSKLELEAQVAAAVAVAWKFFRENNFAAAERALGQEADSAVFVAPPNIGGTAKVRWLVGVLMVLMIILYLPQFKGRFSNAIYDSLHNLKGAMAELNHAKTEEKRFYALDAAAKDSFAAGKIDEARKYAAELMALAPKYTNDWNYGNAIQDANVVFGRIAVREGNLAAAKKFLLAAGRSPGSPQMNSFGPNMSLANDLLEKGERDAVLEYFTLCRSFWKKHTDKLDQWTRDVRNERIPDFGANMIY
jgi:RNA polymerase sigma factor (sigma-70 family)